MKIDYRKAVMVLMLLPLITLLGCGSKGGQYENASARILKALEEKYGEEFELDKIGAGSGTMNDNTIKATVRPKSDPRIVFDVEVTKDLEKVYDKYLNVIVAQSNLAPITDLARQVWSDGRVEISNDTVLTYPTHTDRDMTYEKFLELYPSNWQVIFVFVNASNYIDGNGEMNEDAEIEKYKSFAKLLEANKYVKSGVSIVYLSEQAYGRLDSIQQETVNVEQVLYKEQEEDGLLNSVTRNGFDLLENGELSKSDNAFKETFSVWRETRQKYIEDKGEE